MKWGLLGASTIAPTAIVKPAISLEGMDIVSVAARQRSKALKFADRYHIPQTHESYEALLSDPAIDAIYIGLPNALHASWAARALENGKHVLCEKPLTTNARDAENLTAVAERRGLLLMEGFAYRFHPLATRLKEILDSGELGTIREWHITFSYFLPAFGNIRYSPQLGGGSLLDAGCYPVSLLRFLSGVDPQVISAQAKRSRTGVDSSVKAELRMPDGSQVHFFCSMLDPRLFQSSLVVRGERGELRVFNPFHPHWFHSMKLKVNGKTTKENHGKQDVYALQLDAFSHAITNQAVRIREGREAVGNLRLIEAIAKAAGLDWAPTGRGAE